MKTKAITSTVESVKNCTSVVSDSLPVRKKKDLSHVIIAHVSLLFPTM
jgi:hypothetical protein